MVSLREPAHNSTYLANSWEEVSQAEKSCTVVRTADGDFRFTYNFDFSNPKPNQIS
jgi:hypothetical protein